MSDHDRDPNADDTEASAALLQRSEDGDGAALEGLIVRHIEDLRAFVRLSMPAALREVESRSDVVQSVCREILTHPERFDFRGEGEFRNWLFGAALLKVKSHLRHWQAQRRDARRAQELDDRDLPSLYGRLLDPVKAAAGREEVERIEAAFDRLSEREREIIVLHRFVGLKHDEIAERLGLSSGAVRMALHRGIARLMQHLLPGADD